VGWKKAQLVTEAKKVTALKIAEVENVLISG